MQIEVDDGSQITQYYVCISNIPKYIAMLKKCTYSELLWSVFSRIWTEYEESRKIRSRITPNTDTFHAVLSKRVLEWLGILVSCKSDGVNESEARESKKFIGLIMLITIQEVNMKVSW